MPLNGFYFGFLVEYHYLLAIYTIRNTERGAKENFSPGAFFFARKDRTEVMCEYDLKISCDSQPTN